MKYIFRSLPMLSLTLMISACGGDGEDANKNKKPNGDGGNANAGQSLAGTIDGRAWQFQSGWADTKPGSDELLITLTETKNDRACDVFSRNKEKNERYALISVPPKVGSFELTTPNQKSVTFVVQTPGSTTKNLVGSGSASIDEVTRSSIRGRFSGMFGGTTNVSGSFNVKRCNQNLKPTPEDFVADVTPDPDLKGRWVGADPYLGNGTAWAVDFQANGIMSAKLNYNTTQVVLDADQTWSSDSGISPKRMIRTVTGHRVDVNNLAPNGRKDYCIYSVIKSPGAQRLKMACSPTQFPAEFPATDGSLTLDLTKG